MTLSTGQQNQTITD